MPKKLLIVVNNPDFFISHRLKIGLEAMASGYEVHIASGSGEGIGKLIELGFIHHQLALSRSGKNLLSEFKLIIALYRLFKSVKPDVVHLVTIKPVLYGGIAGRLARVPCAVFAISGLGAVFIAKGTKAALVRSIVAFLYRVALKQKRKVVIFQNDDDKQTVSRLADIKASEICLIKGSGVELEQCPVTPEPDGIPVVTIACRLLRDKGVGEFIEASRILTERGVVARYWVVGDIDIGNPASFSAADLVQWSMLQNVELLGFSNNVAEVYSRSNIVCLPSYREGFPKSLIEAAACGRAVITTDVPGCRDAIVPQVTGILVTPKDPHALADAIASLVENKEVRAAMGERARLLAEQEYSVDRVVAEHLAIYGQLAEA